MHEKVKQSFEALRETLKIHKSLMKKISNVFFSKTNSQIKKKKLLFVIFTASLSSYFIFFE